MKKLIAGNWKMNGSVAGAKALADAISSGLRKDPGLTERNDFLICPSATHLLIVKQMIDHNRAPVMVGGQDCSFRKDGAFTGEISAKMLKDLGCSHVILGHSERRQYHGESDELIAQKVTAAHEARLAAIVCVGETEGQRDAGEQEAVVAAQLNAALPHTVTAKNTVIAYEPVWAIGTGKAATPGDVEAMHGFIRRKLEEKLADYANMRILYGGSVKPDNAAELFRVPDVDGALIGGASLKAEDYLAIAKA